ncbi:DUF6702 family protein [Lutibacter holmesii]|uniref:DUF6702 family protein n=1 Tax=Lutibacter holmesii TaxID=1137985 RepID=A0ABW3WJZ7_9FLAO
MHKYYISLCEIEYNQEQESIQIILGLFIDDIEVVLNKEHNATLNLATKTEYKDIDKYYEAYLNKHFKVIANENLCTYNFIGKEYDDDIVRFYLEIENIQQLNSIEIFNSCLFEYFEDQQNIIKLKVNKLHKSFYLNNNNPNCLLKI